MKASSLVGVDVGGTFTDLVALDEHGLRVHKLPSTPPDYSHAVLDGLAALEVDPAVVVHGSTVATNALLERRGARCALITTRGFRDVLAIGRQARPSLYNLDQPAPRPLVPREWRREVAERVAADGQVLAALDPAEAERVLDELVEHGVEAVAVCFLFSFLRPQHEQVVAELARSRGLYVSASSEILPEFREFERTATTVVNAYVGPLMGRYLGRLGDGLGRCTLRIMQSNGGCIDAGTAGREPVRTILSGPAAGLVGAWQVARAAGCPRFISFDMGGTSTDVALSRAGLPLTTETVLGGLPIRVPALDIHTVGAGGGSVAWRDPGGALAVGPRSAGAEPGPACYGRGGTEPTVTDANVVLGRLPCDRFLGGRMPLDAGLAHRAVAGLARELGLSLRDCALGIVRVAEAAMERAIRVISVERGLDPRQFALLSFGGAGGLHAAALAARLRMPEVLVPRHPGVLSALGLLLADVVRDAARTVMQPLAETTAEELEQWFRELAAPLLAELRSVGEADAAVERLVDVRYRGQSHELLRPCPDPRPEAVAADFHRAHDERFGHRRDGAPVEVVTVRVRVTSASARLELGLQDPGGPDPGPALLEQRAADLDGPRSVGLYDRSRLVPGMRLDGPAMLVGEDTTVLLPLAHTATIDPHGNAILRRREAE